MKRIILFSMPSEKNIAELSQNLFPTALSNKTLAYLPSNGHQTKQIYTDYWQDLATKNGSQFVFVDNMLPKSAGEAQKINSANILLITGGNTYELLHNLRTSGLDQAVKDFAQKDEFILSGFSAGAIVLSPTIATASVPSGIDPDDLTDANIVGITDFTGLGIVDFEIIPHYHQDIDKQTLENYRQKTSNKVREISDDGIIIIDL